MAVSTCAHICRKHGDNLNRKYEFTKWIPPWRHVLFCFFLCWHTYLTHWPEFFLPMTQCPKQWKTSDFYQNQHSDKEQMSKFLLLDDSVLVSVCPLKQFRSRLFISLQLLKEGWGKKTLFKTSLTVWCLNCLWYTDIFCLPQTIISSHSVGVEWHLVFC